MKISSYAAAIALALAALGMSSATAAETQGNADVAATAQQALSTQMGDAAKDLKVTVNKKGIATLTGWAQGPREVNKARYIVSKVPGVKKAYSARVRTSLETDENK